MKVSEAIEQLQALKESLGDIELGEVFSQELTNDNENE